MRGVNSVSPLITSMLHFTQSFCNIKQTGSFHHPYLIYPSTWFHLTTLSPMPLIHVYSHLPLAVQYYHATFIHVSPPWLAPTSCSQRVLDHSAQYSHHHLWRYVIPYHHQFVLSMLAISSQTLPLIHQLSQHQSLYMPSCHQSPAFQC